MRNLTLVAVLLVLAACDSLTGPAGEIPLAVRVDAEGGVWTLVHAVEPASRGPTRQYLRLLQTTAAEFQRTGNPAVREAKPAPALWEAAAEPPLGGPTLESAALVLGDSPAAWVAGHYPGEQNFLTRVAADGTAKRWNLPAGWPLAFALDVTGNASRTWVRPEQWWASRLGDTPALVEVGGAGLRTVARDTLWMGCGPAACAYVTSTGTALVLWSESGERLAAAPTRRAPRFTAACRAGNAAYVVTQAELFAVSVTGFGAPVSAPAAWRRLLAEPGELACGGTPWLWTQSESGTLYALDVTALTSALGATSSTVRSVQRETAGNAWVRLGPAGDGWVSALAEDGGDETMSCNAEGSWSLDCTATYTKYVLRLVRRTKD